MTKSKPQRENCLYFEFEEHWYYLVPDANTSKDVFDWTDYASVFGPFASRQLAEDHLVSAHGAPKGATVLRRQYTEQNAPRYRGFIARAVRPNAASPILVPRGPAPTGELSQLAFPSNAHENCDCMGCRPWTY